MFDTGVVAGGVVLVGVISPFMSLSLLLFSWVSVLVVVEDTGVFEEVEGTGLEGEEVGSPEGVESEREEEVVVVGGVVVVVIVFCASETLFLLFFTVCTVFLLF